MKLQHPGELWVEKKTAGSFDDGTQYYTYQILIQESGADRPKKETILRANVGTGSTDDEIEFMTIANILSDRTGWKLDPTIREVK